MEPTSPSEVFNALARLKAGKLSGLDHIPLFLLKIAAVVIAPTLSFFINLRLSWNFSLQHKKG